jgi:hypothetical protein
MASIPPISFNALAKTAANPASGGYPYTIKGYDLDKNFTFATEHFNEDHFTVTNMLGAGGHETRKVMLSKPLPQTPGSGTHVLAAVNGTLTWLATEEC